MPRYRADAWIGQLEAHVGTWPDYECENLLAMVRIIKRELSREIEHGLVVEIEIFEIPGNKRVYWKYWAVIPSL